MGIFIDTQNLYHSAKHLHGSRVDFAAILKEAVAGRQLIRALAYVITTPNGSEGSFFSALNQLGIEVRKKEIQDYGMEFKRTSWDVEMTLDAIRMASRLDAIIIVSGDGSFAPLVEHLKAQTGIQTEVMAFGRSCSMKLKELADDFFDLSENPDKYLMINPRREKRIREWDNYGTGVTEVAIAITDNPGLGPEDNDTTTKRAYAL
ncbi:MAG TPA: NYN domain-containing protein [Candidatus Paceibacterota bacterium]|nr:NYN domain-containing protein [Candidatus Paceibacterota bacterium]